MKPFTPRQSSPRLDGFEYRGQYAYFVTTNTADRQRVLDSEFAPVCVDRLLEAGQARSFEVLAYCMMPDHVHVLAQGTTPESDLVRFMQLFKQRTGYAFKKARHENLWRRSYYDHVLRDDEAVEDIAEYIWHNPVRAGLAAEAGAYPFSGPAARLGASSFDRAEALSLRLGPLFQESAADR